MIQEFVNRWETNKPAVRAAFEAAHPGDYMGIVKAVVSALDADEYDDPDVERITQIDHGDYQGTLVFVVGAKGYQPSTYWATSVYYGSCSGCDTLASIRDYDDGTPTPKQVDEYMTLALHILQKFRCITGPE